MTDEQQYDFMIRQQYLYIDQPWEMKVREMAKRAVEEPATFRGGSHFPVARRRAAAEFGEGVLRHPWTDVCVRLIPDLERHPEIAQLVAEQIIREQIPA